MIIKSKLLQNNPFDLQKVEYKQLSIQFSLDGFSFCITDMVFNKIIATRKYTFKDKKNDINLLLKRFKNIFNHEILLKQKYDKVLVVHVNRLATFVPKALFNEENISNYLKFNSKIFSTDFFNYDELKNQDMVTVYAPYVHINNFLIDQFGAFEYKHYASVLVENLINKYTSNEIDFFVHVQSTHFEIIVSKNKKLLLYNTFKYRTKEDFIYYILFVFEQLQLDTEIIKATLLGTIKKNDDLYNIVYRYIRNVTFISTQLFTETITQINDVVKREQFILLNAIS